MEFDTPRYCAGSLSSLHPVVAGLQCKRYNSTLQGIALCSLFPYIQRYRLDNYFLSFLFNMGKKQGRKFTPLPQQPEIADP